MSTSDTSVSARRAPALHDPRWVRVSDRQPVFPADYPIWVYHTGGVSERGNPYFDTAPLGPDEHWCHDTRWLSDATASSPIAFSEHQPAGPAWCYWDYAVGNDAKSIPSVAGGRTKGWGLFETDAVAGTWPDFWTHWLPADPSGGTTAPTVVPPPTLPAGYRYLKDGEKIEAGVERYFDLDNINSFWAESAGVGHNVCVGDEGYRGLYRRKVEQTNSQTVTPPNPGEGYRLLNDDEVLQVGDERTRVHSYEGRWHVVGGEVGETVAHWRASLGDAQTDDGTPDPLFYRRKELTVDVYSEAQSPEVAPAPEASKDGGYDYAKAHADAERERDSQKTGPTADELKGFEPVPAGQRIRRGDWLAHICQWAQGLVGDTVLPMNSIVSGAAESNVLRRKDGQLPLQLLPEPAPEFGKPFEPPAGWRFLTPDETTQEGDELFHPQRDPVKPYHKVLFPGLRECNPRIWSCGQYVRKIEERHIVRPDAKIPAGYRRLGLDEVPVTGDRITFGDHGDGLIEFQGSSEIPGGTVRQLNSNPRAFPYSVFIRSVEVATPAPLPAETPRCPTGTPPAGYRWLVEGETVLPTDKYKRNDTDELETAIVPGHVVSAEQCGSVRGWGFVRALDVPQQLVTADEHNRKIAQLEELNRNLQGKIDRQTTALAALEKRNAELVKENASVKRGYAETESIIQEKNRSYENLYNCNRDQANVISDQGRKLATVKQLLQHKARLLTQFKADAAERSRRLFAALPVDVAERIRNLDAHDASGISRAQAVADFITSTREAAERNDNLAQGLYATVQEQAQRISELTRRNAVDNSNPDVQLRFNALNNEVIVTRSSDLECTPCSELFVPKAKLAEAEEKIRLAECTFVQLRAWVNNGHTVTSIDNTAVIEPGRIERCFIDSRGTQKLREFDSLKEQLRAQVDETQRLQAALDQTDGALEDVVNFKTQVLQALGGSPEATADLAVQNIKSLQSHLRDVDCWGHINLPDVFDVGGGSFVDQINAGLARGAKAIEHQEKWHALWKAAKKVRDEGVHRFNSNELSVTLNGNLKDLYRAVDACTSTVPVCPTAAATERSAA